MPQKEPSTHMPTRKRSRTPHPPQEATIAEPTQDFSDDRRKVNCSFRVYLGHVDLIKAAAQRKGVSAASLCRRLSIEGAAEILGVEPPEYASLEADRDVIAEAAALEGLSKQEYMMRAGERAARAELALQARVTPIRRPPPKR